MGNQVVVSFLTDWWHEIKKDPEALVRAIDHLLNYGSESLVEEAFAARNGRPVFYTRTEESRWADRHYVTVHRFQHADVKQVTVTYHNSSWDVHDLGHGIRLGALDGKSNPATYLGIASSIVQTLRDEADRLEKIVKTETEVQASGMPPEDIAELRRKFS